MATLLEVRRGDLVLRRSGDAPTGDKLVDRAFDNLVRIDRFLRTELGRDGWDGKGSPLRADLAGLKNRNATFSTATGTIVLGLRPSVPLGVGSLGFSPTIMGHEVGHGIQIALGKYSYENHEMSAIAESFGDVMGTGADDSNWVVGDEIPGGEPALGEDLRDLAKPPYKTLQEIPESGARSEGYSQLLSYAAVLVAEKVGNPAMRKLWFEGMKRMPDDPTKHGFEAWVKAVQRAAVDLHGKGSPAEAAVLAAFKAVGVLR
ncbi:MAG: M4 family metallopeptidase [Myxococcota bacterium]